MKLDLLSEEEASEFSFLSARKHFFPLPCCNPVWAHRHPSSTSTHNLFTSAEPDRSVTPNAAADIVSLGPYVNAAASVFPPVSRVLCPPWIDCNAIALSDCKTHIRTRWTPTLKSFSQPSFWMSQNILFPTFLWERFKDKFKWIT